jgi:3-isopropylmalate/(R)-2-methylmalate dehydratase small subunit
MPNDLLRGTAWVADDYVYAYDIIKQDFWTDDVDPEKNSEFVMADVDPAFDEKNAFKSKGYSFIVAGDNFAGGGKSIEHVVTGLIGAGIEAVFANSFARLQFRNAINYGLPFIKCEGLVDVVQTGDELEFDPEEGHLRNRSNGEERESAPVPPFVNEVAEAGGMVPYIRTIIEEDRLDELQ